MTEANPRASPDLTEIPAPSAEFVLIRVALSSFLATSKPEQSEAFLKHMAETLADEESLSAIMNIRERGQAAAVSKARRGASAMFRAYLPVLLGHVRRRK